MSPFTESESFKPLSAKEMSSAGNQHADADGWMALYPVPDEAPKLQKEFIAKWAPKEFTISKAWRYRDAGGRLNYVTVRYDKPANGARAEKEFRSFTYWQGPNGEAEWRCKALPSDRPLYGLDRLAQRPNDPVIVVEG